MNFSYLFMAVLAASFTAHIKVPGFGAMGLFDFFVLGGAAFLFFRKLAGRCAVTVSAAHISLFLLLIVVSITIAARGLGLGGGQVGGATYVKLIGLAALFFCMDEARLTPRQWKNILFLMCAASAVPVAAELLLFAGVDMSSLVGVSQNVVRRLRMGGGIFRLPSLLSLALYAFIAVLLWEAATGKRTNLVLWGAFFLGVTAPSGHRLAVISIILLAGIYSFLGGRFRGADKVVLLAAAGVLALVFVIAFLPFAPDVVQRAFAWVPGVEISQFARESASSTTVWRLQVWELALETLPRYWLIGKGFAFPAIEFSYIEESMLGISGGALGNLYWALTAGVYHNGPLGLLLNLGTGGLIFGGMFLFFIVKRHVRLSRAVETASPLLGYYRVIVSVLIMHIIIFVFLYGDVQANFLIILFFAALAEGLRGALLRQLGFGLSSHTTSRQPVITSRYQASERDVHGLQKSRNQIR